jgi:glycosyltransferase involved in cell wall biosynthesis
LSAPRVTCVGPTMYQPCDKCRRESLAALSCRRTLGPRVDSHPFQWGRFLASPWHEDPLCLIERNKPLQIIIPVLSYYPDDPNGAARLAFDEALFLVRRGHKVWVVTQDLSGDRPEYSFQDGLQVLRYPSPRLLPFDPRRARIHQNRTKALLSRYIVGSVDLVHGHSLLHYDGARSLYGKGTRVCYSVHSPVRLEMQAGARGESAVKRLQMAIASRLTHRIEHRCLESSDCITADSNYTKQLLRQLHGSDIQLKTQVVPGWVDLNRFQIVADRQKGKAELGWPTDIPLFFTLRRLVPRMGLDRLLYAFQKVKSAGRVFHLVIGGSGPMRKPLEILVGELDLKDCVSFAGRVPEARLPLMYGATDAFVLPTAELECFGLIALEALACGRPVLATPVGAIPEILGRFEKNWLAHNASIEAIAQLLISFLQRALPEHDPVVLRTKVAENYMREKVLEQLMATIIHGR